MKTFLLIILLLAFLQSAFLPLNLVLVSIIARSLVLEDKENLILAFLGGLILSFLSQVNLGYWPLVFLLITKLTYLLKKLPVSFNLLTLFFAGILLIGLVSIFNLFFINNDFELFSSLVEAVLVIPAYYLVRLWEERFVNYA